MPAAFDVAVTAPSPGRAVVAVSGELDVDTGPQLTEATDALTLPGLDLTLDLSAVTFMDSCGLNTLLRLRRRACAEGAMLRLCGAPQQALRVLDLTGTTGLFVLLPSQTGVAAGQAAGPVPALPVARGGACNPS
ncbi:STAS domain-containing protein [Streptomyces sp. NPDC093801]|uniref:STAS domain-containing protein n=1 Tax=Streptomyces sp. NPDC093801 TaxID=3155203 RepID=UPI00344F370F